MAIASLLRATKGHLFERLELADERIISIQEDAQPEPFVGQLHVVVHPLGWEPGNSDPADHIDEYFSVGVSITQRTPVAPHDRRIEELYLKTIEGIERLARRIMIACHLNYDLINAANTMVRGDVGFCEPLRWHGTDAVPRKVDGSWFYAVPESDCGLVMTVRFGRARRIQRIFQSQTQKDVVE